jgi:peptide/nickel transport system permease protein
MSAVRRLAGGAAFRGDRMLELPAHITARLTRRATSERRWTTVTLVIGTAILAGLLLVSVCAPLLGVGSPTQQHLNATLQAPSWHHLFGTDNVGRDIFSRVLAATPLDYAVGIITTYAALMIGVVVGALAGYLGGWIDALIMRIADVVIAFPFMVFVIAVVAIFGPGLTGIYVGLIAFSWALFARIARGEMLVLREVQYIKAAETLGLPRWRILFRHALPSLLRPNLVYSMSDVVLNILTLAALSYLGLGVQPPTPEWGAIISSGQLYLLTAWWITTLPGLVIVLVGVGFSLVGDSVADRLGVDYQLSV